MRSPNNYVIALLTLAILSCKKNTKNEVSKEPATPTEIVEFNPNLKASYFDTIIDDKTVKLYSSASSFLVANSLPQCGIYFPYQ